MPQVPQYGAQRVQVADLPAARLQINSGAAFAANRELGNVAQQAGAGIIIEEQKKADEIALTDAQSKLKQTTNRLLYDPKTGAMTRKGKDAFDLPETVTPEYDKAVGEIEAALGNDRQRMAFRRMSMQQRGELDLSVQRHVYQERSNYDTETTTSAINVAREAASFNYSDPRRVAAEISDQVAALTGFAQRNGKSAEWTEERVTDATSKTHLGVIEAALAHNDDKYATAYYKEVKSFIKGDEAIKAAKLVEDGTIRGESQRMVDQMTAEGLTRANAHVEVKKIEDPKLRDAVQTRLDAYFNRREQIQKENEEASFEYATRLVDSGRSYEDIPVGVRNNLNLNQLAALKSFAKRTSEGLKPETDWSLYYSLQKQAIEDPEKFAKLDLIQYRHKLDDTEFKEVIGLQRAYGKKDNTYEQKISGMRTAKQVVDDSLAATGIDPTPSNTKTAEQVAQFRRAIDHEIILYKQRNKNDPSSEEVQGMVDALLVQGKVPGSGWIWDDKKRMFELKPGETLIMKVDDIPLNHRMAISKQLQARGEPVTNDAVIKMFNLRMQRQKQQ